MIAQIVPWAFAALLAAVVIGIGWWQIREGGKTAQKAKDAKEDLRAIEKQMARRNQPLRDDRAHAARLRKLAKKLESMRDRETRS